MTPSDSDSDLSRPDDLGYLLRVGARHVCLRQTRCKPAGRCEKPRDNAVTRLPRGRGSLLELARGTTVVVAARARAVVGAGTAVDVLCGTAAVATVLLLLLLRGLGAALALAGALAGAEVFPGVRDDVDLSDNLSVPLLEEIGEEVAGDEHAAAGVETLHSLLGELEYGHVGDREELVFALLFVQTDADRDVLRAAVVLRVIQLGIREQIPGERAFDHCDSS